MTLPRVVRKHASQVRIPAMSRSNLVVALLFLMTLATAAPAQPSGLRLDPVIGGLTSPLFVTHAPEGGSRLFIVEQPGRIKVLQPGDAAPAMFLDITVKVKSGGEQGLLGLAFHPQFATNGRFFVDYTRASDGASVIAEYRASADPAHTGATERMLLVVDQPYTNHNGGMVEFGPDGYLYIGMGDGGSAFDPENRAQNGNELLGKILRIDVDHPSRTTAYSSPPGNPFVDAASTRSEIYALGLRNPYRFSFDRQTGQLYVGDVGQNSVEEIDIVTAGGNYGWRVYEGSSCTNVDPSLCEAAHYTLPIAQYPHTDGRCSITGGYVYRGAAGTFAPGTYVFGDYCSGEIFTLAKGTPTLLMRTSMNISSFGEDAAGEIYVVDLHGAVYRLTANATPLLVEYRYPAWDDYFITGIADEIAKLDAGTIPGWVRTGEEFKVYPLDATGTTPVCRFFSTAFAPRSSHFYAASADECSILEGNRDWQLEGEVFGIVAPDANGNCAANSVPVYRLYNNGQGGAPNHRYTVEPGIRADMISRGWVSEGYGPLGVIMCSPQ